MSAIQQFKDQVEYLVTLISALRQLGFGAADEDVEFEGETRPTVEKRLAQILAVAMTQGDVYQTEEAGRAAVADGEAFKVQGTGDVAAYEYRRVSAGESVLIATWPSLAVCLSVIAAAGVAVEAVSAAAASADIAAGAVSGSVNTFWAATKPAGNSLAASLGNGATVIVEVDDSVTPAGIRVRYTVYGGALINPVVEDSGRVGHSGRSVTARLADRVSPLDHGAFAMANQSAAVQAAVDEAVANGGVLDLLGRTWMVENINFPAGLRCTPNGGTLKYFGTPAGVGQTKWVVRLTGNNVVIDGILRIDGNKSAFGSEPVGNHYDFYSVGTSGHEIGELHCVDAVRNGFFFDQVTDFSIGKHVVHGAYRTGCFWYQVSHFTVGYFDYAENGYGFGKTKANRADVSHDFLGWASIIAYVSHDFIFSDGITRDNGRDGFGIGNGSYRWRVKGEAQFNGDGGFTFFADDNGTGRPGEALPPYEGDLDAVCYGQRGSGIAVYVAVDNLRVRGKSYNNNAIAGQRTNPVSALAGCFIAAGCTKTDVDVECYDTRQTVYVTSLSDPSFGVTTWVTGTLAEYPYVEVRTAAGVLRGYAKITAESSGSLTLQTAPNDGVTLASIQVGDTISQAVQVYGTYVGQSADVRLNNRGRSSNPAFMPVFNATTAGGPYGGGVRIISLRETSANMVANPDFAADTVGGGPANWGLNLNGGTGVVADTGERKSTKTLVVTSSAGAEAYAQLTNATAGQLSTDALQRLLGESMKFGAMVYASEREKVKLRILVEVSSGVFREYETFAKRIGWQWVEVVADVPSTALSVRARFTVLAGSHSGRINGTRITSARNF